MDNEYELRRTYLGGPAAATIGNVNPYQTQLQLWQYLTGRVAPLPPSQEMINGQRLEPVVLAYCGEQLARRIMPGVFIRHAQLPLGGHFDGVVEGVRELVEGKTCRQRSQYGEPGTTEVPEHVKVQCQHYMGLTDATLVWVPVLFSGLEFELFKVERDQTLIDWMQKRCVEWWGDHVMADVPPPPLDGNDVVRLYPRDNDTALEATDDIAEAVESLRMVKAVQKEASVSEKTLEDRIKIVMGEAAALFYKGQKIVTFKAENHTHFDAPRFKLAEPALYAQFASNKPVRKFLVK